MSCTAYIVYTFHLSLQHANFGRFKAKQVLCVFVVRTTIEIKGVCICICISYFEYKCQEGTSTTTHFFQNCPFQSIPVRLVYILHMYKKIQKSTFLFFVR